MQDSFGPFCDFNSQSDCLEGQMDVHYLQELDLLLTLDGISVGMSCVGLLCNRDMGMSKKVVKDNTIKVESLREVVKDKTIKVVLVENFVMIVKVRFFNLILLPWRLFLENPYTICHTC